MPATPPAAYPVDLTAADPMSAYLRATVAVCPYIEPAARAGRCLFGAEVSPDCQSADELHPRLYEQLVPQIEHFRDARRAQPDAQRQLLLSHTVVVRLPPELDAAAVRLLAWPNLLGWTLKHLYTPKAIVLGFVRKGVVEPSAAGPPVPAAPFHAVIIRSRVVRPDARFYPGNDAFLAAMRSADDDGTDVHAPLLGTAPDPRDPDALRTDQTYQRMLRWFQANAPRR